MFETPNNVDTLKDPLEWKTKILEEATQVIIRPEDRNEEGTLLVSPGGPVSNLPEQEWKMVRTESFKKWFGESMVVDENNEPLILYHGSPNEFDQFDLSKVGSNKDSGFFGTGFYFTPHQGLAEKYGPILYRTFLRINHLQVFEEKAGNTRFFDETSLPKEIQEEVLKRYNPLREREYRNKLEREKVLEGNWLYVSTWNGEDHFEYILSDVIREVVLDRGASGVFGHNPVSKLYEYVAFNEDDIMVLPKEKF